MKKRKLFFACLFLLLLVGFAAYGNRSVKRAEANVISVSPAFRPRTVVTTDGECDDLNSFIHLLLCANDLDIRGIVLTSSCYHYAGDPSTGLAPYRWAGEGWMESYYAAYAEVYPNLAAHDARYPSPDALRSMTRTGNIKSNGDMGETTEGSRLIQEEILREEPSTLFVQCWGGSNTVARALMDIEAELGSETDWPERKAEISKRLVIYLISTQDDTYETYIARAWPEVTVLHNKRGFEALAFNWKAVLDRSQSETLHAEWQLANILHENNPLMKLYYTYRDDRAYAGELPRYQYGLRRFSLSRTWRFLTYHGGWFRYGDFLSEGDSPAFLFLLDRRLADTEAYALDNWGGRFTKASEHYYVDECAAADSVGRYVTAINEDFARRVRWSEETSPEQFDNFTTPAP